MPRKNAMRLGQWLFLFIGTFLAMAAPATAQGNSHVIQRGETLFRIALRYSVTVDALAQANGIDNPNRIYAGQVLVIPTSADQTAAFLPSPQPAPAATAPVYHIVQRGETLGIIARTYGISWQDLAQTNGISNPNRILAGQQLIIMAASAPDTAAIPPAPMPQAPEPEPAPPGPAVTPAPDPAQTRTHIVQPGEHLARIARRYGVSWPAIARANGIVDPNRIYAGQALIIPAQDDSGATLTYMEPSTGQPAGPTPTIVNGRQIIVDLSQQTIYAYEDGALLRSVRVSTGLPGTPTVLGDYNVYRKLDSQTMTGPGYYLPGVPWVMYFYQGYAIHGTYWHNNFGSPMSHGCVNLPTEDAYWFYTFADVGTPVRVIP